jgi:hypothetical protein
MARNETFSSIRRALATLACCALALPTSSALAHKSQEPPASRGTNVKIRPADPPEAKAQEQQPENIPPSGATLKTAKTIYLERMPHNLHLYITAELNMQRTPYTVVLDRLEADLWMVGVAEIYQKDKTPSKIRDVGEAVIDIIGAINRESPPVRPDTRTTASVYIVARGGKEVLWASQSGVYSGLGSDQGYVAQRLVKDLRKSLAKAK